MSESLRLNFSPKQDTQKYTNIMYNGEAVTASLVLIDASNVNK